MFNRCTIKIRPEALATLQPGRCFFNLFGNILIIAAMTVTSAVLFFLGGSAVASSGPKLELTAPGGLRCMIDPATGSFAVLVDGAVWTASTASPARLQDGGKLFVTFFLSPPLFEVFHSTSLNHTQFCS
jgi:membrane protein implicated in regulation of membrane protease activity